MLSRAISAVICVAAATIPLSPALAQTSTITGGLQVKLEVNASCEVSGSTTGGIGSAVLDFGSTSLLLSAINGTTGISGPQALEVLCNPGVAWSAAFNAGLHATDVANRAMQLQSGTALVRYQLYADAARQTVLTTATGTGTGTAQAIQVYGQVPAQDAPPPGNYTDTVTVTVSF